MLYSNQEFRYYDFENHTYQTKVDMTYLHLFQILKDVKKKVFQKNKNGPQEIRLQTATNNLTFY